MEKQKIFVGTLEELFQHDFEKKDYFGYVYAIELEHGVKIGRTINPHQRMTQHQNTFEKYGDRKILRVAFSPLHSNYPQNETSLLSTFGYARKGNTEMTDIPFDFVVSAMENLHFSSECKSNAKEGEEELEKMMLDLWGVTERMAKTLLAFNDGLNDIAIKVGNAGFWWLNLNGKSIQSTRDGVLDFIVWYALHHDVWNILEWYEDKDDCQENEREADEERFIPCTEWMLDTVSEYCSTTVIESIRLNIRNAAIIFEEKNALFVKAMYKIARERGYECTLPPTATYEQIVNEDYAGLEPIDPSSLS